MVNRAILGLEGEYNVGAYHFHQHITLGNDPQQLRRDASRLAVFLADELMFGDISILLLTGFYIHRGERTLYFMYNKLSVRYYFPPAGKPTTRFFAGVYLKSHLSTAEYISLGIGASL
jgi:hypothetical protein